MPSPSDSRALRILFDTFWTPAGWKHDGLATMPPEDFEYAKAAGFMFDPVKLTHDECMKKLMKLVGEIELSRVVDAFVASLSSRQLHARSAFGSYMTFHHLRPHRAPADRTTCDICGWFGGFDTHEVSVMNFERYKWGGVRHDKPEYAAFDLERFLRLPAARPTDEDVALLRSVLAAIEEQPPEMTAARLHAELPKALRSNKSERDILIAMLGICDVLANVDHPGFLDEFVPVRRRDSPSRRFVDMHYPACWWTGRDGVNSDAVARCFGRFL